MRLQPQWLAMLLQVDYLKISEASLALLEIDEVAGRADVLDAD